MSRYSGRDQYLDPVSGVLRNRFGITDAATLEHTEAALVATRSYELSQTPLEGRFDLSHLQAIHRYLFGDVYEWAGQLRTVDISKGGNLFAHHAHIGSAATPHYLGELNALHPFREGNGRAQREFVSHLAHATGYYVAWENMKQPDVLQASIESFKGDTSKLAALIRDNLHIGGYPLQVTAPWD